MGASSYTHTRDTRLALDALRRQRRGVRALLLSGPPGAGKTFLGETFADELGAELVFGQLHSWSDADELFYGVDVSAAVAGEAERVRQPGLLARAALASQKGRVVLLIDEVDKAPERVEALLLDALQSGRIPVAPGEHIRLVTERVYVVMTTNATRPHTDALLRRVRRLRLRSLSRQQVTEIAQRITGRDEKVVAGLVAAAWKVAAADGRDEGITAQEAARLVDEVCDVADDIGDVQRALAGWAARSADGEKLARSPQMRDALSGVWGHVVRARRETMGVLR